MKGPVTPFLENPEPGRVNVEDGENQGHDEGELQGDPGELAKPEFGVVFGDLLDMAGYGYFILKFQEAAFFPFFRSLFYGPWTRTFISSTPQRTRGTLRRVISRRVFPARAGSTMVSWGPSLRAFS